MFRKEKIKLAAVVAILCMISTLLGNFNAASAATTDILKKAYITSFNTGKVDVVNLESGTVELGKITVGSEPNSAAFNPNGTQVFVTNRASGTVSVINPATDTVVGTITVGSQPHGVAFNSDGSKAYVANMSGNTLSVINTATLTVTGTISVLSRPVAMVVAGQKLYLTQSGANKVAVVDFTNDTITSQITVGTSPYGLSVNPAGTKIYVANQGNKTVSVINVVDNTVEATVAVGSMPSATEVSPDGSRVYVANSGANTVSVINTTNNTVESTVAVGSYPYVIGVSSDGSRAFTVNYGSDNMSVIRTSDNQVINTIALSNGPFMVGTFMVSTAMASGQNPPASSDATLSSLNLSDITLDQTVTGSVYAYTATVPNDVSVTTATYTTTDSHATTALQLNGTPVNNPISLSLGSNIISLVVTAQDGTTRSYTVTVTRAGSNSAALSSLNLSGITLDQTVSENVYAYTATVPNDVSVTTATYTTTDSHATAAFQLNGTPVNNPISLSLGSNIISFVVIAQDGTTKSYTVNVTRAPQLVTAITVSGASGTMSVGDSLQFRANVTPDNATDKTFSWSVIAGTGEATINADGVLVATQAGTITIQAVAHDGSGVVGMKVITIDKRSSSRGGSSTTTDTNLTPAPVQTPVPASALTTTPIPDAAKDVFKSDVVKGDINVIKNIENRIQEAKKTPVTVTLSDTKGHWAEKTIATFVKLHVIEGYSDGKFKPDGKITRAEFAVILSSVFDIQGGNNASVALKDVGSHWAKDAIKKLVEAGVISGYEDGTFKPDKTITREEMVVLLSRILNLNNVSKDTTKGNFVDLEGSYAANEIKAEAQAGIISGRADGKFDTKSNSTRAEALQIILNALNLNPQLKTLLDSFN
uniref:S-layer homology domain-containing protein n=1 Tax=Paenibacillus kribbensis TaxID=172713 RepID=UPI0008388A91|nr:S-layer homology domain-containing protein [Paenibacillus kribbensis]